MWRRMAAGMALVLGMAGVLRPDDISPTLVQAILTDVFTSVNRLRPMPYGATYTLTVGGKAITADPDYFLRRRSGPEILESGMTDGCGDNAIAALYILEKAGYEALFVDSAKISTESLENGFSGHAVVAVRDPKSGNWLRVDPTRHQFVYPFNADEKSFDGNYWIGFRGRLADYPAHDPDSLKKFYRGTLNTIPKDVLNQTLYQFQFTVDPSLIGITGRYHNPNLTRFLRDNAKILAAHGVHPVNVIPIRLLNGQDNADSSCHYSEQQGWTCILGQRSALSLGFLSDLEDTLNSARKNGPTAPGAVAAAPPKAPPPARGILWAPFGILCLGVLVVLFWQRRRFAGRETAIAYWACQVFGWGALPALVAAVKWGEVDAETRASLALFFVVGILLTHLLRREIRRRRWLTLSTKGLLVRLGIAIPLLSAIQNSLGVGCEFVFRAEPSINSALEGWAIEAVLMTLWVALYVVLTGPRRHREMRMQLQLALREAELRALEAQINPHFLFNCLNSIRALVAENPALSQDMLTRLANILRYNLSHDIEHTVSFGSEVEIVGDYLALESARFEDRLRVRMSIDPDAAVVQVPPMLLQSLVENALKHGIAPLPSGGELMVRATVVGNSMLIEVENPGQIVETGPDATRLGLANIRERLRILYNGRASFELKNRDGHVAATVLLPRTE